MAVGYTGAATVQGSDVPPMASSFHSTDCIARRFPGIGMAAAVLTWIGATAAGWCVLTRYSYQAGVTAQAPASVVAKGSTPAPYTLRMFVHPRCPCSVASLRELARLMASCSGQVDASVHFYRPEKADDDWVQGPLWEAAAAIPGVRTEVDPGGKGSARFGSTTSGDVLLYDSAGRLRFHGGITAARGHEGDNLGKSTVLTIVSGESDHVGESPVFGCVLRVDAASPVE